MKVKSTPTCAMVMRNDGQTIRSKFNGFMASPLLMAKSEV